MQDFTGIIDEIRIWDSVRTQEEINEVRSQFLTGICAHSLQQRAALSICGLSCCKCFP